MIEFSMFFREQLCFERLEESWATLIQAWPIISSRIRKNSCSPSGLVYHIPTIHGISSIRRRELKRESKMRQFYCLDESHRSASEFSPALAYSDIPSNKISIALGPTKVEHQRVVTANSPKSTRECLIADCPLISVQVTKFNDGTLISLNQSHVIGDCFSIKAVVLAWQDILDGKGPPPPMQDLGMDPFQSLGPDKVIQYDENHALPKGFTFYTFRQKTELMWNYFYDVYMTRPEYKFQQRYIFIPNQEMGKLQVQVQQDLESKATREGNSKVEKVSKFNILFAWTMQNSHAGLLPGSRNTTPLSIISIKREKPTGIDVYPRHKLWGGSYLVPIESLSIETLCTMSLGELALHIRNSLNEHRNPDSSRDMLKFLLNYGTNWNNEKNHKVFPFVGSPSDYFTGLSDWRPMRCFDVDFGGATLGDKNKKAPLWIIHSDMNIPSSKRDRWLCIGDSKEGTWLTGGVAIDQWQHPKGFGRYHT